jgi:energy-coupling factor transport system permease protein
MDRPFAVAPVALGVAALLAAARSLANVRRFGVMFVAVPVASFVMWTLFYGYGQTAASASGPPPRSEAVEFAAGMALKLESFLGASVLFLSITRVEEFTEALRGFGMPFRMSFAIALAFRLVPLFLASALSVVTAQRARGLDFSRGNVFQRLARYMPVIVPVFMGALRRSEAMAMALEARGFSREAPRTTFLRSRFTARDAVAAAVTAVVVLVYVWAWARGYGKLPVR